MGFNKTNIALLTGVLFILFILVNTVSFYILKANWGISPFAGQAYLDRKNTYHINPTVEQWPHPYFGLTRGDWERYPNKLSNEPLFYHITKASPQQEIKVLVLGGSVAQHSSQFFGGKDEMGLFARKLNEYFGTNRFVVYNGAITGGKQPQQYFKYLYLDLLGFKPDIVVNLDGFNEIALPVAENKLWNNPAIFPRSYSNQMVASVSVRDCAEFTNKVLDMNSSFPAVELMAMIYAGKCHKKLSLSEATQKTFAKDMGVSNDIDYIAQSVNIWRESSNKLALALNQNNIDYIHVLQPNQYFEGSKILSETEKQLYTNLPTYGNIIRSNYAKLSSEGLITQNFRDQRYLFKNFSETVYSDNCCHFNQVGMESIVNDIITSNKEIFAKHLRQ